MSPLAKLVFKFDQALLRVCSSVFPVERLDRSWYDLTGKVLRARFGDDGRWGYEADRTPYVPPKRYCAECGKEVVLPGDNLQINDDYFHVPCHSMGRKMLAIRAGGGGVDELYAALKEAE
jgi:hypothetical protein